MDKKIINERVPFLIFLLFLASCFVLLLKPFLIPLSLAIIFAIIFNPLYSFLLKYLKKKYLASFVCTSLIFIIFLVPLGLIVGLLTDQILDLISALKDKGLFSSIKNKEFYQENILPYILSLEAKFGINIQVKEILTTLAKNAAKYFTSFSPQVLGRTATFVFNFIIMLFSLFFFFIEGKNLFRVILTIIPIPRRYQDRLVCEGRNTIYATIYGYLLTALIQAVLAWIGFWLWDISGSLILAVLSFFMSLVPIFGATAVWLPVAVYILFHGDYLAGGLFFLYGAAVISGVDNFVKPLIMRGKVKIHVLLIFFSLLGGIMLFGPIGILFGPIVTALFLASLRIYREDYSNQSENTA